MARLPKPLVTITGTALTSIAVALVVVGADSAAATAHVSRTLTVAVDGSGSVTSGPAGINCPSQTCQTTFADGTAVSLTATAATGSVFNGWGGDCAGQGATCNVTMQADRSVTANFATRDVVPTIGTAGATTAALPPATKPVEVSVSGDGTVVSTQAAVFPPATSARAARIRCGGRAFACYVRVVTDSRLTLTAKAGAGSTFDGWRGACSGVTNTCRVVAAAARSVRAVFSPQPPAGPVAIKVAKPAFHVHWRQSVASGALVVAGWARARTKLLIGMRLAGGVVVAAKRATVPRGRFRQAFEVVGGKLPSGTRLLPGGFVVSVTGSALGRPLPRQVLSADLARPPAGVVAQAYTSASLNGRPASRLAAGTREVWAHFAFAAQPGTAAQLRVVWIGADGKPFGTVGVPNRPVVVSYIRSTTGLAAGTWRADLRVAGRLVRTLRVTIG